MMFEFDVVQIQPGDPKGESPHAARYQVDATVGQERPFLSRLRPGRYLFKNFYRTGMSGTEATSISSSKANRGGWSI